MASKRSLYVAATIACLTAALFGYSVGFIGGVLILPSFLRQFQLDILTPADLATARSLIVTVWLVGALFGVPLAIPICSRYGRKVSFQVVAILYSIGAALQLASFSSINVFLLGRWLNGLATGAGTLVSPMYISEISPPAERGMLMSGYQTVLQSFALIGFWGAFVSHAIFPSTSPVQWELPVAVQLLPSAMLLFGSLVIPDSPTYLASQGRHQEAEKSLAWLRMLEPSSAEVLQELAEIEQVSNIDGNQPRTSSLLRKLRRKDVLKRLGVGVGLMITQNMVGQNALNFYAPVIFLSAGFTSVSTSLLLTGIFGLVKLLSALAFMCIFVRLKTNRFWLQLGSLTCAICMIILAFYVKSLPPLSEGPSIAEKFNFGSLVPVLMVYIFSFAFSVSLGPISWNVCSEIFPLDINTFCCAVTTCTQWLFQIVIAAITPRLLAAVGWRTYIVYASCALITLVWIRFCVPETRDVPLGKPMDRLFGVEEQDSTQYLGDEDDLLEPEVSETSALLHGTRARRASLGAFA